MRSRLSPVERVGGSFRDPAAFVFTRDGVLYRQVNLAGREVYDALMASGLYEELTASGDLVRHAEVDPALAADDRAYRVLRPERVTLISYPYEWCFSQLKDAALLTLRLQRAAMKRGMSLKDATAYNVQFDAGRPVWIDTLSFEPLRVGAPWVAYRQFCEFYVAPLALMRHTDVRLHQLCVRSSTACRWIWPAGCCRGTRASLPGWACTSTCTQPLADALHGNRRPPARPRGSGGCQSMRWKA